MKILITGGAGFIGTHLTRKLRKNHEVALLIHKTQSNEPVQFYSGDILDRDSLLRAFSSFQPEIVFHLAAQPIVRDTFISRTFDYDTIMTNIGGTQNLFDVSMRCKSIKKIIHISTDKVFGDTNYIQQTSCLVGTKHPYNASKLAGDVLAQMFASYYSIPTVIVRHGNVYGEGDLHWDRVIPRTIRQIHGGNPPIIRGDGTNTRDYIHVDDITDAYIKLMEHKFLENPFIVHFGADSSCTVQSIIDNLLGLMGRVDLCPTYEPTWVGEIPHQHIESFANARIGWNPKVCLDDGLRRTVTWYKEYLNG